MFLVDRSWIWSSSWLIYVNMKKIKSLIATKNYEHTITTSRQTGYSFCLYDHLTAHVFQPSDIVSRTLLLQQGLWLGLLKLEYLAQCADHRCRLQFWFVLLGRQFCSSALYEPAHCLLHISLLNRSLIIIVTAAVSRRESCCVVDVVGRLEGGTEWEIDRSLLLCVLVFCFHILFGFLVSCLSIQKTVRLNHRSQRFFLCINCTLSLRGK